MNYYNEIDPRAAAWLRELIAQNLIPKGHVDERDIRDVTPAELSGYAQCHFFAGIGGWSLALQYAGWPEDKPVWTGSCPCQPFSAAGRKGGSADERHLWPHWFHLIEECRPSVLFGEQVASKDGLAWFDLVSSDLEGAGYAVGANDLCAAGVGSPQIRQRLWFVGVADTDGKQRHEGLQSLSSGSSERAGGDQQSGGMADADDTGSQGRLSGRSGEGRQVEHRHAGRSSPAVGLADADSQQREEPDPRPREGDESQGCGPSAEPSGHGVSGEVPDRERPRPTNGFWRDADWLFCQDDKWRPVESGTFPLADGLPARVGRLRGYGNAISPEVGEAFIEAVVEVLESGN